MEKLIITEVDCDIIKFVGNRRLMAAEIADGLGLKLQNAHNKLVKLCARGLMSDSFKEDTNRAGLHAGEKRRVYTTTAQGRNALALFVSVKRSLAKVGSEKKPGQRTAKAPRLNKKATTRKSRGAAVPDNR